MSLNFYSLRLIHSLYYLFFYVWIQHVLNSEFQLIETIRFKFYPLQKNYICLRFFIGFFYKRKKGREWEKMSINIKITTNLFIQFILQLNEYFCIAPHWAGDGGGAARMVIFPKPTKFLIKYNWNLLNWMLRFLCNI